MVASLVMAGWNHTRKRKKRKRYGCQSCNGRMEPYQKAKKEEKVWLKSKAMDQIWREDRPLQKFNYKLNDNSFRL